MRSSNIATPQRGAAIRRWAVAAAVAATALAAAGCGGGAAASAGTSERKLPGILEFGLTEEEFTDHVERTQQLIAECMADAGFEYIPVDVKTIKAAQARVRTEPGYTRRTYKEKWGLGVTTRFDNPVRDTGLGPNLAIYESLRGADKLAYERTLWGDNPDADFAFTLDEEDFSETGGCTRTAVEQVFTPAQIKGSYVNPKDVLVDQDPRITEARKRWSECMHAKGYEYEGDQDEIIEELQDRLAELTEGDDPATLTGQRAIALEKLQQEEIELALADLECQIKHTDKIYRQVEFEVFGQQVSG